MTYPLRLPRSLKKAVEQQSKEDRTSINQFVATAVAEKLSALQTAEFFTNRKSRADFVAFDKIMKRRGGRLPRAGDEVQVGLFRDRGALANTNKARKILKRAGKETSREGDETL